MRHVGFPLIVTNGFDYYENVVRRLFGIACVYGQVLRTRRNDRVLRVDRRPIIGARWGFVEALVESEDSSTLDRSFIERLKLTIHQGTAYLKRRSACHARSRKRLEEQIEILLFHYHLARPHRALKFGSETRTPAMQAGLMTNRLTFRDVFSSNSVPSPANAIVCVFAVRANRRSLAA